MSAGSSNGGRTPRCPECATELRHEQGDFPAWLCPSGHGVAATLPATRRRVGEDVVAEVWAEAYRALPGARSCPFCRRPMTPVSAGVEGADPPVEVPLDLCRPDQLLWFDAGELDALPARLGAAADGPEPPVISHPWADATERLSPSAQYGLLTELARCIRPW